MTILGSLTNSLGNITTSADTALHQKLHEEYLKIQAQKAMQAQQSAYLTSAANTTVNNGAWTTLGLNTATQSAYQSINLEEGAWDVPVSQLVDLWTVRFGSKWVDTSELDEFYSVAVTRLSKLNKIESHYVNGNNVYRIVE